MAKFLFVFLAIFACIAFTFAAPESEGEELVEAASDVEELATAEGRHYGYGHGGYGHGRGYGHGGYGGYGGHGGYGHGRGYGHGGYGGYGGHRGGYGGYGYYG